MKRPSASAFRSVRTGVEGAPAAESGTTARLPYPDGWFVVAFHDELPAGRVLTRRLAGEDVVLYRTRSGVVRAVRPFCPHLGAHLGHGGRVDGEDLVCPFHNFAFSTSGDCVRTGCGTPPPKARLVGRDVREVDGAVLVWHHARGLAPDWEVPSSQPAGFRPAGHVVHTVSCHPQDIMENTIDSGHCPPVHQMNINISRTMFSGAAMEVDFSTFPLEGRRTFFLTSLRARFYLQLHGLGWLFVYVDIPKLRSRIHFWILPTPVEPLHVELRLAVNISHACGVDLPRSASRLIGKLLVPLISRDLAKDFPIWQHKTHVEHPKLTKGDGPFMQYRRWAGQFYSESLP
ncbi:Rieske 2Fe-2S domain-containing protein [Streptomyces sp. VNUA116]|uniref:Rieske 2Fe-2S domain-containing protein n=1 Tax=Streptomyces sp. VNUA116 TaxID=3062449 RepID=UPI002675C126|nr:Rieske 2Fe-2S domain-containing protein [Streptomyces sp. VNUA116]WKU48272.1 Rieske 2Fe-2S domain-containing protein [Streptomyces sp. VNUA116]